MSMSDQIQSPTSHHFSCREIPSVTPLSHFLPRNKKNTESNSELRQQAQSTALKVPPPWFHGTTGGLNMPSTDFTDLVWRRLLIKTTMLKTLQLLINTFMKTKNWSLSYCITLANILVHFLHTNAASALLKIRIQDVTHFADMSDGGRFWCTASKSTYDWNM